MLNSRVRLLVENNFWFQDLNAEYLALHNCEHVHEVFERVFLNVASRVGLKWKDIFDAKSNNPETYAELIVALLLIEKTCRDWFQYDNESLEKLLGIRFFQILEIYHESVEKK